MMKKYNKYISGLRWMRILLLCSIILIGLNTLMAQPVQVGDVLTFADGSKGIVCYVDPNNCQKGWAVDMNDLNGTYKLYTKSSLESSPSITTQTYSTNFSLNNWVSKGKANTMALYQMKNGSNNSPAAIAVNPESGWYIPDADQMMKLVSMAPLLQSAFERAGFGNITNLLLVNRHYWTSTRNSSNNFYYLNNNSNYNGSYLTTAYPDYSFYIRRVRDFDRGNEPHAFWVDEPKKDSIWVKPEVTTSYDALVVYLTDTFEVSSSIIVHPTFNRDTVDGDTVFVDSPYDKLLHNVIFHVTGPGNDTIYDTLKTVNGCDSIQTVILRVRQPNELTIYDTVCQSQINSYSGINPPMAAAIFGQTALDSLVRASGYMFKEKAYLKDASGNDSVVNYYLTVNPWTRRDSTVAVTNWQGGGFTWYDSLYTQPGSHARYTQLPDNGCDILDILHLVILDIDTSNNEICLGDSTDLTVSATKRKPEVFSELIPVLPDLGDVLCTDGSVLKVDSFLNSGKTAKGVVLYVDEDEGYGVAVALSNAYSSTLRWASNSSSYYQSIRSLTTSTYLYIATQDLNGSGNTDRILTTAKTHGSTSSYAPAAHYCYYYDHTIYGTGSQPQGWYLPAAGEMMLIYSSRVELNKTLNKLRSQDTRNTLLSNSTYWTSTEYSTSNVWYMTSTGSFSYSTKPSSYYARPVIKFPLP